jgi:hypothetical protein
VCLASLFHRRLRRRPRGRMPTSPVMALDAISTKRASGLFWRQAGSRRTNPSRCSTACIPRTLPCSYRGYRLRTIYWLLCRRDFGNIGTNPCSLLLQMRLRQACQVRALRLKRLASALRSCPLEHPLEIYRAANLTVMPPGNFLSPQAFPIHELLRALCCLQFSHGPSRTRILLPLLDGPSR